MSACQAVAVIGVSLLILVVMNAVMTRVIRADRQLIERQREAWKAAGEVGPYPDRFPGDRGYHFFDGLNFGGPGV
jgi:hypothetical protein